jgi:GT2 family glycosyltransferase
MIEEPDTTNGSIGQVIDIIMPVYNGEVFIVKSLPPLLAMKQRGEVREVVVVDDSSVDSSVKIAEELGAKVISTGGRLGPGAARNQAATVAEGDLLWFVDSDVVVHDDAIEHLLSGFSDENVVAVFGSYDDQPAAQNFLSQYKNLVHHHYHNRGNTEASTFWAGCGAVRKKAFLDVGGFDAKTYRRPTIEDIDLGYRLIEAGGQIRLVASVKGSHLKVWRLFNLIHTEVFCRAIPWSRLMLTRSGLVDDLNVSATERIKAMLAGLLMLALAAAVIGNLSWWIVWVLTAVALVVNKDLFLLFNRRKGLLFALGGVAFHQLYYLYSGFAFVYSWLELHWLKIRGLKTQ